MIPEQRGITNARAVLVERFISACCRLALKWLASHLRPSRGAPPYASVPRHALREIHERLVRDDPDFGATLVHRTLSGRDVPTLKQQGMRTMAIGGSGFIGHAVVRALMVRGARARCAQSW